MAKRASKCSFEEVDNFDAVEKGMARLVLVCMVS